MRKMKRGVHGRLRTRQPENLKPSPVRRRTTRGEIGKEMKNKLMIVLAALFLSCSTNTNTRNGAGTGTGTGTGAGTDTGTGTDATVVTDIGTVSGTDTVTTSDAPGQTDTPATGGCTPPCEGLDKCIDGVCKTPPKCEPGTWVCQGLTAKKQCNESGTEFLAPEMCQEG